MLFLNLFNSYIKPTWYDVLQDVLLNCLTLVFSRVYRDIKGTSQQNENIRILGVFPRGWGRGWDRGWGRVGSILWIPTSTVKEPGDLIPSSDNLAVNVMI